MMPNADWRDLGSVEELEDIHSYEHLCDDYQDISLCHHFGSCERGMKISLDESNVDERVSSDDQDQNLCSSSYVMVDEASPCRVVHTGVDGAIEPFEKESLEDVEADEEVENEDYAYDKGTERSELGDGLERNLGDMWTTLN